MAGLDAINPIDICSSIEELAQEEGNEETDEITLTHEEIIARIYAETEESGEEIDLSQPFRFEGFWYVTAEGMQRALGIADGYEIVCAMEVLFAVPYVLGGRCFYRLPSRGDSGDSELIDE